MNRASLGPAVMWRGMFTSCLLLVAMCMVATCAQAQPVTLGTFGGDTYAYEDSTIIRDENTRLVWIVTASQRFNYTHNRHYAGALGRFVIDCSGHTYAWIEGITLDKHSKVIQHGKIPQKRWKFVAIQDHTPQFVLYRRLCSWQPTL